MGLTAAARRYATWTALLAVLAAALMPALSHALAPGKDSTKWIEVCSTAGAMSIEVPADGPGFPKAPKASDFEHCPFCSAHAAPAAILTPALSALLLQARPEPPPPLFLHAPRPLFAWTAAQPRAPPLAP